MVHLSILRIFKATRNVYFEVIRLTNDIISSAKHSKLKMELFIGQLYW